MNNIKFIFKNILKLFLKSINNEIKIEIKELKYINLGGINKATYGKKTKVLYSKFFINKGINV